MSSSDKTKNKGFTMICNECKQKTQITDDYKNHQPVGIYDGEYHTTKEINMDCQCGNMVVFDK